MKHRRHKTRRGMSLVELLIGLALGAVVLAVLGQAFLGSKVAFQLNRGYATLQDNSRFSLDNLETQIRMAGYQDRSIGAGPVRNFISPGNGRNNDDSITLRFGAGAHTKLVDCNGNPAPSNDRIDITYAITDNDELACTSETHLDGVKSQQVIAAGIEQFRVSYLIDDNRDGIADRSSRNPAEGDERGIVAVELCLIVTSGAVTDMGEHTHLDCDGAQKSSFDGLMRRRYTTTVNLRNQALRS